MADFIIINGTDAELTNVNAGGDDVAARAISAPVTLTGAELLVVAALDSVAVMQTGASAAEKGNVASCILDNLISDVSLATPALREAFELKRGVEEYELILAALNLS
jgi:hypothetical protein